ncbi:MAG: hypothetical protein IT463_12705 [Planctomycetes bacterium]|nr:hypothetical protein [Planctomycetota bacterium]
MKRLASAFPAVLFLFAGATGLFAQSSGPTQPTSSEQLAIYEINRARANPQKYDTEKGLGGALAGVAAQQPLAVNLNLTNSSRFHSTEFGTYGYFDHQSAITGTWPNKMARNAGYSLPNPPYVDNDNFIESIAAVGSSGGGASYAPADAIRALILDAGVSTLGHRIHLLAMNSSSQAFREVGTGYATGKRWDLAAAYPSPAPNPPAGSGAYWTIHTGVRAASKPFLTGIVYNDANSNGRFDLNEGVSGVTVYAWQGSGVPLATTTNSGGGWAIEVLAGTWGVTAYGGSFGGPKYAQVTVSASNIAVDFRSNSDTVDVNFGGPSGGTGTWGILPGSATQDGSSKPATAYDPTGSGGGGGGSGSTGTGGGGGGGCASGDAPSWALLALAALALLVMWRRSAAQRS